ncbi:MAG: DUF5615 family PIN-like protein [Janthinobacterium lividum]
MKFVVDMNLSPDWVATLQQAGYDAVHWSNVGAANASDDAIMIWARHKGTIALTSDLDLGTLLATSGAAKPSVVQLRTVTTLPSRVGPLVLLALRKTEADPLAGSIVTVEDDRVRLRPLTFDV